MFNIAEGSVVVYARVRLKLLPHNNFPALFGFSYTFIKKDKSFSPQTNLECSRAMVHTDIALQIQRLSLSVFNR